jgi:hypothetical protein
MEAKMFVHHTASEAEKAVNEWLGKNNVNVQYIGQSQSEKGGRFVFIVSVFYLKNENRGITTKVFEPALIGNIG